KGARLPSDISRGAGKKRTPPLPSDDFFSGGDVSASHQQKKRKTTTAADAVVLPSDEGSSGRPTPNVSKDSDTSKKDKGVVHADEDKKVGTDRSKFEAERQAGAFEY
ncbi:hypothetical protein FRX31_014227, partial [Thalictrum thalictroides]